MGRTKPRLVACRRASTARQGAGGLGLDGQQDATVAASAGRAEAVVLRARHRGRDRPPADEAYADLAPMMIGLRAEGLSLRAIADRLNAEGHTTRRGKPGNPVQGARVLARVAA